MCKAPAVGGQAKAVIGKDQQRSLGIESPCELSGVNFQLRASALFEIGEVCVTGMNQLVERVDLEEGCLNPAPRRSS